MSEKESFAAMFAETGRSPRRFGVGDKVDVTVTKVGKIAIYVSLDESTEGYIDAPELADKHGKIDVEVGTRIHARVAEVGGRSGAVRLTPVAVRDQYDEVQAIPGAKGEEGEIVVGMKVKASVQKVERFGIFVNLLGTKKRALLRAQDTGTPRGADLNKLFAPGKELDVKVIQVTDDGKIGVSISALAIDEERENFAAHEKGEASGADKPTEGPKKPGSDGKAPKSLGTLGSLFANVKLKK